MPEKNNRESCFGKNFLFIIGILSAFFYISLFSVELLRDRHTDRAITTSNGDFFIFSMLVLLMNLILYYLGYRFLKNAAVEKKQILSFALLFNAILFLVWPITSNDIFGYIAWIRIFAIHHANPYIDLFYNFSNDLFFPLLRNRWLQWPIPYGPLFVIIGSLPALIGSKSIILAAYSFKLLFVLANIAVLFFIYKKIENPLALFLYGWNPVVLFEICVNGHSDILTIFFLCLCIYFLGKDCSPKKLFLAWMFLVCSVLIKYYTFMLIPLFLLLMLKADRTKRAVCHIFLFSLAALAFTVFLFQPFWAGADTFQALQIYMTKDLLPLFAPLVVNGTAALLSLLHIDFYPLSLHLSGKLLFICGSLLVFYFMLKEKSGGFQSLFVKYSTIIIFLFLFSFPDWVLPWYYTPLLFLAALYYANNKKMGMAIMAVSFASCLYYFILR